MLVCNKCKTENPLGAVFCRSCGDKLDLSGLTSQAVSKAYRISFVMKHKRWFTVLPVLVILILIAVAFWPQKGLLGEPGTLIGGRRVVERLKLFEEIPAGSRAGADPAFIEKDVNGYFEYIKMKKLGVKSCSVSMEDGSIRFRIIKSLGGMDAGKFQFTPTVSFDLVCVQMGSQIAASKAWIGHLPAKGPLRTAVVKRFYSLYTAQSDWQIIGSADDIRLHDGAVGVVVQK